MLKGYQVRSNWCLWVTLAWGLRWWFFFMLPCENEIFVHIATCIERAGNEGEREAVRSTSSIALVHFTKLEVHHSNFQNWKRRRRKPWRRRGLRVWLVTVDPFDPGRYCNLENFSSQLCSNWLKLPWLQIWVWMSTSLKCHTPRGPASAKQRPLRWMATLTENGCQAH